MKHSDLLDLIATLAVYSDCSCGETQISQNKSKRCAKLSGSLHGTTISRTPDLSIDYWRPKFV